MAMFFTPSCYVQEAWWNALYRHVTQCRPMLSSLQVGNNIKGDFKKLHKDFDDLKGLAGPYAELTSLLPQQPAKKRSLVDLVWVYTGKKMDKDLGEGALYDWTSPSIPADQLEYAVNDAAAGLEVYEALLRKKEGITLPSGKETGCAGDSGAGGAGAYGSVEPAAVGDGVDEVPWDSDLGDDGFYRLPENVRTEIGVGASQAEGMPSDDADEVGIVPDGEEEAPREVRRPVYNRRR